MNLATLTRHGRTVVAAGLLLFAAIPAAADFKQDYLKGVEALDKGNWAEAATLLRSAMAGESRENARIKFYGVRFEPYLVHFQLGEALARLGECREAVAQFDESERQGVIQGVGNLYERLKASRDRCRGSIQPATPAPTAPPPLRPTATPAPRVDPRLLREAQQRAQNALADATRSQEAVRNRQRRPEYRDVFEQRSDLGQRLDSAAASLERARGLLEQGEREDRIADLEAAATLAVEAKRELEDVQHAAEIARSLLAQGSEREREERRQQLLREIAALVGPAERLLARGQALSQPGQELIAREHRTLELVLAQARESDSLSVMQLEALADQLRVAEGDLSLALERAAQAPSATPVPGLPDSTGPPSDRPEVPPALRSAIGAYLRADYRSTLETLQRVEFSQPRAAAVAHLFRSAARYLLYLEGGSHSDELKEGAAEDVRATRTTDPGVAPLPEVFSPAFIQFFDSVR